MPCAAMSLAGIAAVSWVLLTKVVVRLLPFHCTTELGTKLEPFTVRVKADPLAEVVEGDREVTLGTGLFTVGESVLVPPPPPQPARLNAAATIRSPWRCSVTLKMALCFG